MTAPTTTPSEPGFYALLARLHGHRCPMSILGARLGRAAREALGPSAPGERLEAVYRHTTCALDGIQLATGCTPGNRNLTVEPAGTHELILRRQGQALGVRARLTEAALDAGRRYTELRDRAEGLPAGSRDRTAVEAAMAELLADLETAPDRAWVAVEGEER